MNTYSIGDVAKLMGVTTYTLRYYEKEGLLPNIRKNSAGLRRFSEQDLVWLNILECLKSTGLPLKEIKHYLELSKDGDKTVKERMEIFLTQKKRLERQIQALKDNMEKINFKIKYYEAAIQDGEKNVLSKHRDLEAERKRLFEPKK
ncbi:MAG: MerR family transcriptional regulator [Alphaproteobacteria bacterium]|nr:MerR family transcriptional regulator [Alphaproteobacteria bacterium]